jgi:hypothetical protein
MDLRDEEELRTTAGDDGAAADMVNALPLPRLRATQGADAGLD